jgi:hypothetical protein
MGRPRHRASAAGAKFTAPGWRLTPFTAASAHPMSDTRRNGAEKRNPFRESEIRASAP